MNATPQKALNPPAATNELHRISDADLLDAWSKDRHGEAFETLIARYSRLVLSVCRRRCRSVDDAEDAFQSTFLHLARNAGKIRRPECLPGWLHTVAQRASIATLSRIIAEEPMGDSMDDPTTADEDPLDRIARRHESMVLDEELATLPEHYRASIVMHVYEGWTFDRLAEHFETTLGVIRGRVQRGKRMLAHRLRRRGIVPVVAFAAASATMASTTKTAAAAESLIGTLGGSELPEPPIPNSHLEPLLQTGSKVMTPWNIAAGIAAVGTLTATLFLPPPSSGTSESDVVSISSAESGQPYLAQLKQPSLDAEYEMEPERPTPTTNPNTATARQPQPAQTPTPNRPVTPATESPIESPTTAKIRAALEKPVDVKFQINLQSLGDTLEELLGLPVILNERAVSFGKLDLSQPISFEGRGRPLRSALRRMLHPLGLKATIEQDALVITADHHALALQGIGTDRWLNVDDEKMRAATSKLAQPTSFTFDENPLSDALTEIAATLDIAILIDERALEEIGLDKDVPVSVDLKDLPARSLLDIMLRDNDLTVTVMHDVFTVTTVEAAEDELLSRIYWLEGIGSAGDFQSLLSMIESSIEPERWEALGGSSTITLAGTARPAIVVNSTYNVHCRVEKLLKTFRENSFLSEDAKLEMPSGVTHRGPNVGSGMGNMFPPNAAPPAGGGMF